MEYIGCIWNGRRFASKSKIGEGELGDEAVYESLYCSKPLFYFQWLNDD